MKRFEETSADYFMCSSGRLAAEKVEFSKLTAQPVTMSGLWKRTCESACWVIRDHRCGWTSAADGQPRGTLHDNWVRRDGTRIAESHTTISTGPDRSSAGDIGLPYIRQRH